MSRLIVVRTTISSSSAEVTRPRIFFGPCAISRAAARRPRHDARRRQIDRPDGSPLMTVSLEGIQKVYANGFKAVNNLDLEIRDGEFFTLLGPSGCGKTTTLRMIAGLETASSGRIFIGGRDFTNTHPPQPEVRMGFA